MIKEHDFNKILHRKIKNGNEFKNLIPASDNSEIFFEKSQKEISESDVFDTLENMALWSRKHAYQMQKMAPLLQGATKAQTVRNIFSWLYWHFQYKLDDATGPQNLYSPKSAYANRFEGFDCKSFSIQASTILQCLQIDHSFRMVKQVGLRSKVDSNKWIIDPNNWSHVYVIVPDGNLYHVIDATTHDNKEVKFRLKHDYPMLHRGLNGPVTQSLGCACQGSPTSSTGLGNPQTLGFAITNFHKFLDSLEKQGVSRDITNTMLALVKYNVERGIDPDMHEIFIKAVNSTGNGQLGVFGGLIDKGVQTVAGNINNISVGGFKATDVVGAFSGDTSSIMNIAKNAFNKIIPANFISSTFGAVFANGFDLSCWGASLTPQTAQENLAKHHNKHFAYLLENIKNATTLDQQQIAVNAFIKDVYSLHKYYYEYKPKAASWSGCAKKGIQLYQKYMESLKLQADNFVSTMQHQGAQVTTLQFTPLKFFFTEAITGFNKEETKNNPQSSFVDYPQLNLTTIKAPSSSSNSGVKGGGGLIKGTGFTKGNASQIVGAKNPSNSTQKAPGTGKGISPLVLLSVAGIVAKIVL